MNDKRNIEYIELHLSTFFAIDSADICVDQSKLCQFWIQMEILERKLPPFRIEMKIVAYTM